MSMIYPLDYLGKTKIDFSQITDFDTMYMVLESLKDGNFKKYLEDLNKKFDSFLALNNNIVKDILCEKNVFKNKNAKWFYENIFSDITKKDGKIILKKKIIYTMCEDYKNLDKNQKTIKLNGLGVLEIKYINISTLIKLISKYKSEDT